MRLPFILAAFLATCALLACTKGEECDTCTRDSDCKGGFVCAAFADGSHRCGSGVGATVCRVP